MFRKLQDRLSAAASAVMGGTEEQGIQSLQAMGFGQEDARRALQATNGNVDRAAEVLLSSVTATMGNNTSTSTANTAQGPRSGQNGDDALNIALQESLQTEEMRQLQAARSASRTTATTAPVTTIKSAAANRAGQAALARASGTALPKATPRTVCAHHPDVKVPTKLEDKSKEEQLMRCADRMRSFPRAVDTLMVALTSVQKDPDQDKFRKIDRTTAGYQRSLANAPGAEDMLKAMNFTPRGPDTLILSRDRVDPALLYLGISALETMRQTVEYKEGKRKLQFEKQVREIFNHSDASTEEAIKRANHMSKCPSEPTDGRGALMQVKIADDTVRRRFDGDDTLEDILNWLGGHSSAIYEKILSREWSLVDLNRYPLAPIDCEEDKNKTLQYIGCWPSGRMEVLPSSEGWEKEKKHTVQAGVSRGLGSAPNSGNH